MKPFLALLLLVIPVSLLSQNFDIKALRSIQSPEDQPFDDFFRAVSNSNVYFYTGVPVTMAIVGLVQQDNDILRNAASLAAGTAVTYGIALGFKYTVKRDRPYITYPDIINKSGHDYDDSYSFPSGHTSTAFATATGLSLDYPKWYVIVPSCLYAGTVAYSRMELGVHYPTDLLAAALIGSGCAWLSHAVNKKLGNKSH